MRTPFVAGNWKMNKTVAEGRDLGDTTTLADATVVEEIRSRAAAVPQED